MLIDLDVQLLEVLSIAKKIATVIQRSKVAEMHFACVSKTMSRISTSLQVAASLGRQIEGI